MVPHTGRPGDRPLLASYSRQLIESFDPVQDPDQLLQVLVRIILVHPRDLLFRRAADHVQANRASLPTQLVCQLEELPVAVAVVRDGQQRLRGIRQYAQEHGASERMANLVGLCMEEMVAYPTALHADTGIHTQIMGSFAKDHTRFMMLDDGRCTALDELPDSPLRSSTITSSSSASPRPWNTSTS